jgi:radical SAM superfamily enzyme YgiQ (UPF0313 family)
LKAHLTFTVGLPGETKETIRRTLEFAKELKPYSVQISITIPFPGTKYFDDLRKNGYLMTEDWKKYDGRHCAVMRTQSLTPEEIFTEHHKIKEEWIKFNAWKQIKSNKYHYLKQGIKDPWRVYHFFKNLMSVER